LKKSYINKNHPKKKKVRAPPFVLARWRQNKTVGIEQEKVSQVVFGSAEFASPPPNQLPKKNITRFKA
jgi:hypothetical protein